MFRDAQRSSHRTTSLLDPGSNVNRDCDGIPEILDRASQAGIHPLRVLVALGLDPAQFERHLPRDAREPSS